MKGLIANLECIHQVDIDFGDDDIWDIEKGEIVECKICDDGIKLKVNEHCWYTLKPSTLEKYFKVV